MSIEEIQKLLEGIKPQLEEIDNPAHKISITTLLNLVESLFAEYLKEKAKNQR